MSIFRRDYLNRWLRPAGREALYADFLHPPLGFQPLGRHEFIAYARLVLGPSSGPMHLASLCRFPHFVRTDRRRYARGHSSRDKYERLWNPLGAEALVMEEHGFDPPVEAVLAEVDRFFSRNPLTAPAGGQLQGHP